MGRETSLSSLIVVGWSTTQGTSAISSFLPRPARRPMQASSCAWLTARSLLSCMDCCRSASACSATNLTWLSKLNNACVDVSVSCSCEGLSSADCDSGLDGQLEEFSCIHRSTCKTGIACQDIVWSRGTQQSRTSDRDRRNWARRLDWLELRCQDRVRVRRIASELESSPIVIESQLSSSRSKSPELTRRRRLWLSESDIAVGLFRVHVAPRGAASPAVERGPRSAGFFPVERTAAERDIGGPATTSPKMNPGLATFGRFIEAHKGRDFVAVFSSNLNRE